MYRLLISLIAIVICSTHVYSRKQWTERQAWKWYDKVGIIKGFNQPEPPYPGIPLEQILKKAHDMGLNSVRFWTSRDADDPLRWQPALPVLSGSSVKDVL